MCKYLGVETHLRNESEGQASFVGQGKNHVSLFMRLGVLPSNFLPMSKGFESEHTCWDPKDGELCLVRVKPWETLVKARSDTDVQIVRQNWV